MILNLGLTVQYDPAMNIILVTAEGGVQTTGASSRYEILLNLSESSASYQIDHTPSTMTIPGGNLDTS